MEANPRQVDVYIESNDSAPFDDWMAAMRDQKGKVAIERRIARLETGLLGDYDDVGEGVIELIVDVGPGYRVYCADDGKSVLLLCAGPKKTQQADIKRAKRFWQSYKNEGS